MTFYVYLAGAMVIAGLVSWVASRLAEQCEVWYRRRQIRRVR